MKRIYDYIIEAVEESSSNITKSNKERKEQLEKLLSDKGYSEYIKTLNDMLENDEHGNMKALLIDGFGGELADTEFEFNESTFAVKSLRPTQSEIDVYNSISFPLVFPANLDNYFGNAKAGVVINNIPLITFRGNYIIDGHHRWSQLYAFNPDANIKAFDYNNKTLSAVQMLKAVQGSIAAVKAEHGGEIPQETVKGQNIFDKNWTKEKIVEYVVGVLSGKIEVPMKKNGEKIKVRVKDEGKEFIDTLTKYKEDLDTIEKAADYIASNLIKLKTNNEPELNAPNRGEMPQTDAGGPNPKDKNSSMPKNPDSALGKLKNDGIYAGAVK